MPIKRGSEVLAVPDITEDAAERKRVLNVLAQRRYRKRKKDGLQTLQSQVLQKQSQPAEGMQPSFQIDALDSCHLGFAVPDVVSSPEFHSLLSRPDVSQAFSIPQPSADNDLFACLSPSILQFPLEPAADPPTDDDHFTWLSSNPNQAGNAPNISDQLQLYQSSNFTFPDDHIIEIPSLKLLNAATKVALRLNVAHILWDLTAISPFYRKPAESEHQLDLGLSPPSLTSSSSRSVPRSPPTDEEDNTNPPQPPESDLTTLPPHLHPTATQRLLPHHPMLDILPWPSTRDKLIQIFNLPTPLRPKSAQDPIGMVRLAYDMEDDSGEGIRIHGADPFEPGGWEIGQVVFERWWWAFENGVVDRCDRARRGRGEAGLRLREIG
ncbi:hypothetical protein BDW59DRAFT_180560 [Aspergillus cavernicola]|uniref:BZIP domain-containing protein n=1 Tax=Aspergillus cavernicola TaxID=176166 RepID=A0ABR4I7P0_9EURO